MAAPAPTPRRKIKKVVGGHGHHGGAWKVAYADFVTAMMALFMVMWLLASSSPKARQEISNYFRSGILPDGEMAMNAAQSKPSIIEQAPTAGVSNGMAKAVGGEGSLDEQAKELSTEIKELLSKDGELAQLAGYVTVRVTPDGVMIEAVDHEGKDDLLFDLASSKLKPALTRFLTELAPVLGTRSNDLEIFGNTDARPFVAGASMDNWDLSYHRASAAREILESGGVRTGQIVGVAARGASEPYDPEHPLAASNRRLSILLRNREITAKADAKGATQLAAQPMKPPTTP